MFQARRNVFDYERNPYYVPNGKFNIQGPDADVQMPNCTQYAFLRCQEASDQVVRQRYWIRPSGGYGDAKEWFVTSTLPKGNEPRLGAIACFNGEYGHVAIVERIYDDFHVDLSESNYSPDKSLRDWHFWNYRTKVEVRVGKATIPGCGAFMGYLYPPVQDLRVKRDISRCQVLIDQGNHNVRRQPDIEGDLVLAGSYPPAGIYDVYAIINNNGYRWLKLSEEHWVAETGDMEVYIPDEDIKAQLISIRDQLDLVIQRL